MELEAWHQKYETWRDYVQYEIEKLKKVKQSFHWEDFKEFDILHLGSNSGIVDFMKEHEPGNRIIDVGSGLGGPARMLNTQFGSEVVGVEYIEQNVELSKEISHL